MSIKQIIVATLCNVYPLSRTILKSSKRVAKRPTKVTVTWKKYEETSDEKPLLD